jgi:hypothetical protein
MLVLLVCSDPSNSARGLFPHLFLQLLTVPRTCVLVLRYWPACSCTCSFNCLLISYYSAHVCPSWNALRRLFHELRSVFLCAVLV